METLFSFLMSFVFRNRWFKWQMRQMVRQALWMRNMDLELTQQTIKRLEWEISDIDAKLKTLAEKKEQANAAAAKSSRMNAVEIGKQQARMLETQMENDQRKLNYLN